MIRTTPALLAMSTLLLIAPVGLPAPANAAVTIDINRFRGAPDAWFAKPIPTTAVLQESDPQ